jgi:hypothetical protein
MPPALATSPYPLPPQLVGNNSGNPATGRPSLEQWGDTANPREAMMAAIPYQFPAIRHDVFRFHANAKISADDYELIRAPDVLVASAPITAPHPSVPWDVWEVVRDLVRSTERLHEAWQCWRAFDAGGGWPQSLDDLYAHSTTATSNLLTWHD